MFLYDNVFNDKRFQSLIFVYITHSNYLMKKQINDSIYLIKYDSEAIWVKTVLSI